MQATVSEIARVLGIADIRDERVVSELLTDSRSLARPAETLFFALRTHTGDGHNYLLSLYAAGVRAFVVSDLTSEQRQAMPQATFLVVSDAVEALQKVASTLPPRPRRMVAITGSRGKTTLKEWLYQMLETRSKVVRSPRSWNSRIGVPLSLWETGQPEATAFIEAGVSRRGEMDVLRRLIRPDVVIITTVGTEHSEGFSSPAEQAREKAVLAKEAEAVIYDADAPLVAEAVAGLSGPRLVGWSLTNSHVDLFVERLEHRDGVLTADYVWRGETKGSVRIPANMEGMQTSVFGALAYLLYDGMDPAQVERAFEHLHPIGTRLDVTDAVNNCSLVADSYTSDYSSLRPALDFVKRRKGASQTFTLILSDIHHEVDEHVYERVAALIANMGVDRFIGVGPQLTAHRGCFPPQARFFADADALMQQLSSSDFSDEIILLKGSSLLPLTPVAEMLEARQHETVLEVNLDAIVKNYNYFRSQLPPQTGLIAMVKASGYGAGSYEIAKTLQPQGASYLAVAVLDEGIELRRAGITMPIMVMNPKVANYRAMFANHLEPEIYSMQMLDEVIREAAKNDVHHYPVHIKLDTGMHRMGFIESELPELCERLTGQDYVEAATLFSHLATADCPDMDDYTELQLDRFARYTDFVRTTCGRDIKRHVLNSAGILRFPEHHYDYARLGIGLYGANTLPPEMEKPLQVVSTLRTPIISIREWQAGESIGYGRRGVLTRDSRIATIPIGYADGMNRHFGRGAISVLVNGKLAPTVGNICMDACMIDVTDIDCRVGDSVEIFGPGAPLQRLADCLDTIPYEVLTSVSPRVKRVYYRE